ncbi:MAG: hypothetical protein V1856_02695 [Candidatus Liptonbacteria bacterium]
MPVILTMRTKYYCSECRDILTDNKIPNMNKRHRHCGSILRVLEYDEHAETEEQEER